MYLHIYYIFISLLYISRHMLIMLTNCICICVDTYEFYEIIKSHSLSKIIFIFIFIHCILAESSTYSNERIHPSSPILPMVIHVLSLFKFSGF